MFRFEPTTTDHDSLKYSLRAWNDYFTSEFLKVMQTCSGCGRFWVNDDVVNAGLQKEPEYTNSLHLVDMCACPFRSALVKETRSKCAGMSLVNKISH
jgi:hypothetical protein